MKKVLEIFPVKDSVKVFSVEELTDEQIELIKNSKMDDKYAYLDEELKDWNL